MQVEEIDRVRKLCEDAFRGTRIFLAYAYGSRVNGRARSDSDLDVGYYVHPDTSRIPLPVKDEMLLAAGLSEKLGLEVDLRSLDAAPLELRGRVLEEGVRTFCSDEAARVNHEAALMSRYHDYKPLFREMHNLRLRAMSGPGRIKAEAICSG